MGFGGPHAGYLAVRDELRAPAARPAGRRLGRRRRRRRPTGSRCRPASSTSAARRRPATSAPRRCCSPSWPALYAVYHGPEGLRRDRRAGAPQRRRARRRAARRRRRGRARRASSTPSPSRVPGRAAEVVAAAARAPASTCASSTPTRVGDRLRRDDDRRRPARGRARAFGVDGRRRRSTATAPTRCPAALRAHVGVPHPPGLPPRTAPRPRCCATCARSPTRTSRSTAR